MPGEVDRLRTQREFTRLDPREEHEILDEAAQAVRLTVDHAADPLQVALGNESLVDRLGVSADRRQRSAQVMRDVGQELPLAAPRAALPSVLLSCAAACPAAPIAAARPIGASQRPAFAGPLTASRTCRMR